MPPLRIIPLGGLGEIGMNLMVIEYGDASIVVDCGMMFPDAATLGVDVIVPDMTYILENAARL
jgi:ribonuclease J